MATTDMSEIFSQILTPDQVLAGRSQQNDAQAKQYIDAGLPYNGFLQKSLGALTQHLQQNYNLLPSNDPLYNEAVSNQKVLQDAAKTYSTTIKSGTVPEDAQVQVLSRAMSKFMENGNYEAVSQLAPAFLALQSKQAELAKLRQETVTSQATALKDYADAKRASTEADLAPDRLKVDQEKADAYKRGTDNAVANGEAYRAGVGSQIQDRNALTIVDLKNAQQGPVSAVRQPDDSVEYTDAQGNHHSVPAGQYQLAPKPGTASPGGDTLASKMQPAMLASVKLDIDEIRYSLDQISKLKVKTGGAFFASDDHNAVANWWHKVVTPQEMQKYEAFANRTAVALASMQSAGRGQVSNAKVNEARKLVSQLGDKKGTIDVKVNQVSRLADLMENILYSPVNAQTSQPRGATGDRPPLTSFEKP